MQPPTTGTVRLAPRLILAALAAIAALLAFQASSALAAPQTQTWIGGQPATPDIQLSGVTYFRPSGVAAPTPRAGTFNLSLDGRPVVTYCLEVGNPLNSGTVTSDVTPVSLTTADERAELWILLNQAPTGAVTAEKQRQAAAGQVAIWVLRNQIRATAPTSDAALNADVAALIATARAQTATPSSLSMTASPPPPGDRVVAITVSGKPGAVVALSVTAGSGVLSATSVTLGADGKAIVTVTGPGSGTSVAASTPGDGTLFRIDPIDGSQMTAVAAGGALNAGITISETRAAAVTQVTGSLRIKKRAPATAKAGANVRYRIRITNPSQVDVTNVVLRDRIPSGMSFVEATRGGEVENGRVVWELGTLRAGGTRTVSVVLQASITIRGDRSNVATVSATGVKSVRAAVGTLFRAAAQKPRVQQRQVPVTG
jgi:uncharacterized repeat protein (TIGR01451 family)